MFSIVKSRGKNEHTKTLTVFTEFIKISHKSFFLLLIYLTKIYLETLKKISYLVDKMETMKKRQDSIIWTF